MSVIVKISPRESEIRMKHRTWIATCLSLMLSSCATAPDAGPDPTDTASPLPRAMAIAPIIGGHPGQRAATAARAVVTGNGIDYHGGPVMTGTTSLYYIWYGGWGGSSTPQILSDFATGLADSPIYRVNSSYGDGTGNVTPRVRVGGSVSVGYSRGTSPDIWTVVDDALSSGSLPVDSNGLYVVLTSADVGIPGFCASFCGWHSVASRNGVDIKFSFVGDSTRCGGSCGSEPSPNGNPGADGMASILFHELSETVTDPLLNAWFDASSEENGDKCAWQFGATYTTGNGGLANVRLGSRDFLLQEMWLNAGGGSCVLNGPGPGVLVSGTTLTVNQAIVSPDGQNRAVMQPDGNFVLYQGGIAAWATGTNGSGATRVTMQRDSNLVIYDAAGRPKWASGTSGSGADALTVQNDGNLVVYAGRLARWASGTNRSVGASLSAPATLGVNLRLISSDGRFEAVMQTDGNFVLYQGSTPLWATGTKGSGANHVALQSDGNLVVYDAANNPKWASRTNGRGGARLTLQNDGNLVLYTAGNSAVWASNTSGH